MEPYGKGSKGILVVALCPGKQEDETGKPLVGPSGKLTKTAFNLADIDMDEDCIRTNVIRCRPEMDEDGKISGVESDQIKCCRSYLEQTIQKVKPKLIVCLGAEAINEVLSDSGMGRFTALEMRGRVIPSQRYKCWVGCAFHPAYALRSKDREGGGDVVELLYYFDITTIVSYLNFPLPKPLTSDNNILVTDASEALLVIEEFILSRTPVTFDYETTCLNPFESKARILTVSISNTPDKATCIPLGVNSWSEVEKAFVESAWKRFLTSPVPKVIQNYNFEYLWSRVFYSVEISNFIHDTMVASHVIHCNTKTTGLEFQTLELTGHNYKHMVDTSNLANTPLPLVASYNCFDSRYQIMSYQEQIKQFFNDTRGFNSFLTKCMPVLARMTYRGIRLDKNVLADFKKETVGDIEKALQAIRDLDCVKKFQETLKEEVNLNSPAQRGKIIYDILGCTTKKKTKGGTARSVDQNVLAEIYKETDNKEAKIFISNYDIYGKYGKFLKVIKNYEEYMDEEGYVHPYYTLNTAESYRSAAQDPPVHQIPKRDKILARFRKAIVPSPGRIFYEVDHAGSEVRVLAMVSKDRVLTKEILEKIDTHRLWASKLYEKDPKNITKEERFEAKNSFVFASFYGAEYESIARNMDLPVKHLKKVQDEFWRRYAGVKAWQNEIMAFYNKYGYIKAVSGFRRPGPLSTFQIYNTPIQGPSFHLLLDELDRIDNRLETLGLKSVPNLQVHDSILFDMVPSEADEVVALVTKIIRSKRFTWQGEVMMDVEWSCGTNLLEMKEVKVA
jgi:DNA polymerase-1